MSIIRVKVFFSITYILPYSFFFFSISDARSIRRFFISNKIPSIWIVISGARLVIAISPNAFVELVEENWAEKPIAIGKTNALEIGPDATLPESNAIAEKSDGLNINNTKINI